MALTGGCFCGRVRYQVNGPLSGGRGCHCSRCRKAFSGAGSAYAEVTPGTFSWISGADNLTNYASAPGWGNECMGWLSVLSTETLVFKSNSTSSSVPRHLGITLEAALRNIRSFLLPPSSGPAERR
jgi:hypothetical protein